MFILFSSCTFRFPSTSMRILFENYSEHPFEQPAKKNNTVENSNVIYAPLKISIPEHDKRSPFPSPTGTISAANSCPTSPRQNYQDYHHMAATHSYTAYNHHNNNHLQNSSGNAANHSSNSHNFENVNSISNFIQIDFELHLRMHAFLYVQLSAKMHHKDVLKCTRRHALIRSYVRCSMRRIGINEMVQVSFRCAACVR